MTWNSWFDSDPDDEEPEEELSAYDRAQLQAMSRAVAESRRIQKELDSILFWLATRIDPGEVDERLGKTPFAFSQMKPGDWKKFFEKALHNKFTVTAVTPVSQEAMQLRKENEELRRRLAEAEARLAEVQAERNRLQDAVIEQRRPDVQETPEPDSKQKKTPDFTIPQKPPTKYAILFSNGNTGQRELAFLAILAGNGYSAEASLRWELVQYAQRIATPEEKKKGDVLKDPDSGSIKRLIKRLEKRNLIQRHTVTNGQSRIIIVTLTELGKAVTAAMNVSIVESEWARLMRLHGGQAQEKHAAQVCLFTHYARQRGWTTRVCPEVEPPADPDVLIEKDGQQIYVEVEAGSGSPERRMKKWRNQRNLQGFTAICAPSASVRKRLVREARANSKKGMATDFMWLRDHKKEPELGLWAYRW